MPSRNKMNTALKLTVATGLLAGLLGGCGIRGNLKVPPPVFGASNVDPDRVPDQDLDKTEKRDPEDLLDQDFADPDFDGLDSDPFADDQG